MDIEAVIRHQVQTGSIRLPPSPATCVRLSALGASPEWTVPQLELIVKSDPALAALTLRVANSAASRPAAPITSLTQAVQRLGIKRITSLGWATAVAGQASRPGVLHALRQRAWRQAVVAAHVAEWLSAPLRLEAPDLAFSAGLLHDLGKLTVLSALEELLTRNPDADTRSQQGWWALAEDLHVQVGTALALAWSLPPAPRTAVAKHHEPGPAAWLADVDEVVNQVEAAPRVEPSTLGAIASLTTAQCEALAAHLPELVEALRLMDPELPAEDTSPFELDGVAVSTGRHVYRATLIEVTQDSLMVDGSDAMAGCTLVYVRTGPLACYAKVEAVMTGVVRLKPWALNPAAAEAFQSLSRSRAA